MELRNGVLIVHVTDIHIKKSSEDLISRAKCVGAVLAQNFDVNSQVVIAVGGDLAWSGRAEQYSFAKVFLSDLIGSIRKAGFETFGICIAPGNHDCDFLAQNEDERSALYHGVQDYEKAPSLFRSMSVVQKNFMDFCAEFCSEMVDLAPVLKRMKVPSPSDWVSIDALNTSWGAMLEKSEGHLPFVETDLPRSADDVLNVLVAHHPPNWFIQEHKIAMQRWIDENYDIVFYGHEHYNEEIEKRSRHSGAAINFVAGSAFLSKEGASDDGFSAVLVTQGVDPSLTQATFRWVGSKFVTVGPVTVKSFSQNPAKKRQRRSFSKDFQAKLDDPGIQLNHPHVTRQIRLNELYVEPKLIEISPTAKDSDFISHADISHLLGLSQSRKRPKLAIIFGPEQCGKTSLCKQLCLSAQVSGLVPLLLDVASLSSANAGEITSWLNKSILETYVGGAEIFYQADLGDRIIIIDGIERLRGRSGARNALIEKCFRYGGSVIGTMSAASSTEGILSLGKDDRLIQDAEIYEFSPLGKSQTIEIIEKWFRLGQARTIYDEDYRAKSRQFAVRISVLLGKHGLPPFPLSVLLLLQLTEALREDTAIVADGSFGYIMESLIVNELQKSVTFPLNIAIGYLGEFAWYLEERSVLCIDEDAFSNFHNDFLSHGLTVDEQKIKKELVTSNFLKIDDGSIKFKYPYIFHFFLAKHLSGIESTNDASNLVDKLLKYIHTEKAASVLTFLAHFSASDELVEKLINRAKLVHPNARPVDFWAGSSMFSKFNSKEGRSLLIEYEEQAEDQDVSDDELDHSEQSVGEVTQGDMFPIEDDPIGWASSLKVINILGQVLRSRSTRMNGKKREEIVTVCLGAARRTLGFAFDEIEKEAPALIHASSGIFEKLLNMNREKAVRHANSFLGWLVVALSCTYLFRFGRACGAEEFSDMNAKAMHNSKNDNDRIFMLSARVLGEKRIVEDSLVSLYEKVQERHLLPTVLIRKLARYRLHLSPPEETQRRRIARKLSMDGAKLKLAHIKDKK